MNRRNFIGLGAGAVAALIPARALGSDGTEGGYVPLPDGDGTGGTTGVSPQGPVTTQFIHFKRDELHSYIDGDLFEVHPFFAMYYFDGHPGDNGRKHVGSYYWVLERNNYPDAVLDQLEFDFRLNARAITLDCLLIGMPYIHSVVISDGQLQGYKVGVWEGDNQGQC